MQCTYTLTENDYLKATKLIWGKVITWMIGLCVLWIAVALLQSQLPGSSLSWTSLWPLVFVIVFLVFIKKLIYKSSLTLFRQNRFYQGETTLAITEEGLIFTSSSMERFLKWREIIKWKHTRDIGLIYVADKDFMIIPLASLSNPQCKEELLSRLAAVFETKVKYIPPKV